MVDKPTLIDSPLSRTHSAQGHTLSIQIYRGADGSWILEVVDELGTSTVWGEPFDTDVAALEAAIQAIERDGAHHFVTEAQREAQAAEPEWLRKLAQVKPPVPAKAVPARGVHDPMAPLTDEELGALDRYLLNLDAEEGMPLDMLDGFLHAIAMGPETVMPSRWLPRVWGQQPGAMLPPVEHLDEAHHLMGLVMRHYNSIVSGLEQRPPLVAPLWGTAQFGEAGEFEDAEIWAHGFTEAVQLNPAAWQPLLEHAQGPTWYRPIGLLGAADFSPDQDELTLTPQLREALAQQIETSLVQIHAFWLPLRQAAQARGAAQRLSAKVGRNKPCPCGSGQKFKKCCGAASELH